MCIYLHENTQRQDSHSAPDGLLLEMEKRNLMLLIKNWILAQGR